MRPAKKIEAYFIFLGSPSFSFGVCHYLQHLSRPPTLPVPHFLCLQFIAFSILFLYCRLTLYHPIPVLCIRLSLSSPLPFSVYLIHLPFPIPLPPFSLQHFCLSSNIFLFPLVLPLTLPADIQFSISSYISILFYPILTLFSSIFSYDFYFREESSVKVV